MTASTNCTAYGFSIPVPSHYPFLGPLAIPIGLTATTPPTPAVNAVTAGRALSPTGATGDLSQPDP